MTIAIKPIEARRARRDEVLYRTSVRLGRAPAFHATVVDISTLGCMVRCERAAAPGDAIGIALPDRGDATGKVVWAVMGRVGVEFDRPIEERDYARLLTRLGAGPA